MKIDGEGGRRRHQFVAHAGRW